MAERQTDYTIMEGYELPSKGKIYSKAVNPHVELRSMTARDEMKRLSPSSTPLKTLADIIEGCCVEQPGIHVYDMSLGDYEFLLHKLRIVTYGEDYKVGLRCPDCGEKIETIAKLGQLDVKEYELAPQSTIFSPLLNITMSPCFYLLPVTTRRLSIPNTINIIHASTSAINLIISFLL